MKDKIVKYLKENVINRPLKTDDVIYYLENGKLKGIYSDLMTFSDLSITENVIQFDMTTITNEKIYSLGLDKKHIGVKKDYTGTSAFRYELAVRKSTGEITGYVRSLSSTVIDHTMEAVIYGVYDVALASGQLKWKEQQLFYRDLPSENGEYHPVAFDSNVRFYLEEGKLRFEYVPKLYDVNPSTMTKILSANQCPSFISKEITTK